MNERIDNLMVKAGAYFGGEGVDYSNFDPKKLAELIVQECADIAYYLLYTQHCSASECAEAIKEHFGVK